MFFVITLSYVFSVQANRCNINKTDADLKLIEMLNSVWKRYIIIYYFIKQCNSRDVMILFKLCCDELHSMYI